MAAAAIDAAADVRAWPLVDLRTVRLDEPGSDGFQRSWIMLFPEGRFQHPQYGTLDFSAKRLAEIQHNYETGAREIDIALDRDHDQGAATGWLERLEIRQALGDQPAGLWGLIRWTPLGVQLLRDQQYRYFSPEFKPDYINQVTGRKYRNVLIGGALTNRPFLKVMPAVALSDVSTRPWGEIDKACLPRSAFLDQGDPGHPSTWRLPVYEGTGPKDADGRYTKRGKLNINGVKAALGAIHGARSGKPMSGVPAGTATKLQGWLDRYTGGDGGDGGDDGMTKKANELMGPANEDDLESSQGYDDGDGNDDGDGFSPDENTHGPANTDGHKHGKYAMHSHDGEADHSDAELADDGKQMSRKASERNAAAKKAEGRMTDEREARKLADIVAENRRLNEQYEALALKLYEREVSEQLSEAEATLGEDATFSRAFGEQYKAIMLSEAVRGDAELRGQIHQLVTATAKHVVDTRSLGGSFDQEQRRTRKGGRQSPDDEGADLLREAEKIALAEYQKPLMKLSEDDRVAIMLRAADETSYRGSYGTVLPNSSQNPMKMDIE